MIFAGLGHVGRRSRFRGPDYLVELILPLGDRFIRCISTIAQVIAPCLLFHKHLVEMNIHHRQVRC
jgi:hypothetical protein